MAQKERLLEIRKRMKKKRPSFRRVESWRYVRVKDSWRKARGIDSQTRKKTKTGVRSPSVGYRSPKKNSRKFRTKRCGRRDLNPGHWLGRPGS